MVLHRFAKPFAEQSTCGFESHPFRHKKLVDGRRRKKYNEFEGVECGFKASVRALSLLRFDKLSKS